jgi:hypothetical protein
VGDAAGRDTGLDEGRETGGALGRETGVELGRDAGLGEGRETGDEPPPRCDPPLERAGAEPRPPPCEAPRCTDMAGSAQRQRLKIKLRAKVRRRVGIANSPAPKGSGRLESILRKQDARPKVRSRGCGA